MKKYADRKILQKCEICGQEFIKNSHTQKYCCKKCNRIGAAVKKKKRSEEKRKIRDTQAGIFEIARLATECGMTYGKYVAKTFGK